MTNFDDDNQVKGLNWYFQFKDTSTLRSFMEFNRSSKLSYFFVFMNLFLSIVMFPAIGVGVATIVTAPSSTQENWATAFINFCLGFVLLCVSSLIMYHRSPRVRAVLLTWWPEFAPRNPSTTRTVESSRIILGLRSCARYFSWKSLSRATIDPNTPSGPTESPTELHETAPTTCFTVLSKVDTLDLCNFLIVVITQLFYGLLVVRTAVHGCSRDVVGFFGARHRHFSPQPLPPCEHPDVFIILHCFVLFFLPFFFFASMPDLSITVVWFVLASTILVVIWLALTLSAFDSCFILLIMLLSSCFLIVDTQLHKVRIFSTATKLAKSLDEIERNAAANHVMEMRHMIANVAHDLKTVSRDFVLVFNMVCLTVSVFDHYWLCTAFGFVHDRGGPHSTVATGLQTWWFRAVFAREF
jgi:hypothetical protein